MLVVASRARAEEDRPQAVLTYERGAGAEQCPNEPSLRRSVAAHLGYDPFVPEAALHVTARITSSRRGLRGTVTARERGEVVGEREIPSPTADCVELARALALAISVAVDPFSLTRGSAPPDEPRDPAPPEPPPPDPVPPPAPPAPLPSASDERAPEDRHGFLAGARVGLGVGSVPRARPLVGLALGYDTHRFGVTLLARYDAPAAVDGPVSGSVRAQAFSARALACARFRDLVETCGGVGAQLTFAAGRGVDDARRDTFVSPLLATEARVRVRLRPLDVIFALGLDVPFARPRLRIQLEPAWTMPPVLVALSAGIELGP